MTECGEGFTDDADVNAIGVIDSHSTSTHSTDDDLRGRVTAKRQRMMKYQEDRLRLRTKDVESKILYRTRIADVMQPIADKI